MTIHYLQSNKARVILPPAPGWNRGPEFLEHRTPTMILSIVMQPTPRCTDIPQKIIKIQFPKNSLKAPKLFPLARLRVPIMNKEPGHAYIRRVTKLNGDVDSRSSVSFWITLIVGGATHTDPASDPKTRIQQS